MNFQKKIYLVFLKKDQDKVNEILSYLENDKEIKSKNYSFLIISDGSNDFLSLLEKLKDKIIASNYEASGIVLDDLGIAASIYLNKFNKFIVASLTDEHSAYMTKFHNNTNVINLGFENLSLSRMKLVIKKYLISEFEKGRHLVRIEMLDKMC